MPRRTKNEQTPTPQEDIRSRIQTGTPRPQTGISVLGPEHLKQLNSCIKECEETGRMCQACIDAGIDVAPEMKVNQEQLDMARKLKAHFFPNAT